MVYPELHVGWHVEPLARSWCRCPRRRWSGPWMRRTKKITIRARALGRLCRRCRRSRERRSTRAIRDIDTEWTRRPQLAVDVGAKLVHVPPLSASPARGRASRHHNAGCNCSAVVPVGADRHALAVRRHRYRPGVVARSPCRASSMSAPTCPRPAASAYTRTWPAFAPLPSFPRAPIATPCCPRTLIPSTRSCRLSLADVEIHPVPPLSATRDVAGVAVPLSADRQCRPGTRYRPPGSRPQPRRRCRRPPWSTSRRSRVHPHVAGAVAVAVV